MLPCICCSRPEILKPFIIGCQSPETRPLTVSGKLQRGRTAVTTYTMFRDTYLTLLTGDPLSLPILSHQQIALPS